jgi:hypothetical protein
MADISGRFHYEGFSSPNGTVVPDDFFDLLAPNLTEAELRVLLYIIRRTFGFKKEKDNISLKQLVQGVTTKEGKVLDRGAGVAKSAAVRAVKGLIEKGIVMATRNSSPEKGDEPTTYQIRFRNDRRPDALPVSSEGTRGPLPPREHPRVLQKNTQETVTQQTDFNLSNIRKAMPKKEAGDSRSKNGVVLRPDPSSRADGSSFQAIGAILKKSANGVMDYGREPTEEQHQVIRAYVESFAGDLADRASLASSTARALNLFRRSGLGLENFIRQMYKARSITKERSLEATITSTRGKARPAKRKMAYFFACLEDNLGLRASSENTMTAVQQNS